MKKIISIVLVILLIIIESCKLQFIDYNNSNNQQDTSYVNKKRLDSILKGYKVHKVKIKKNE